MYTHTSPYLWLPVCVVCVTQEEVYRATTKGLIEGLISGYNATVFAYGPTGGSAGGQRPACCHTHARMHARTHAPMHAYTHIHTHIHTHTHRICHRAHTHIWHFLPICACTFWFCFHLCMWLSLISAWFPFWTQLRYMSIDPTLRPL